MTYTDRNLDGLIEFAHKNPYFNLEGYMERDWIVPYNGQYGIRLHRIVSNDNDRAFHDHPWPNTSVVLDGGYWELMPEFQEQKPELDKIYFSRVWRKPGDVIKREANTRHRLELEDGHPALSMFIMGPWEQDWGFYSPEGKVYWREYLNDYTTQTTTDKIYD